MKGTRPFIFTEECFPFSIVGVRSDGVPLRRTLRGKIMKTRTLHIAASLLTLGASLSTGVQAAPPPKSNICGDTAGNGGKDVRCSCGNTVTTNTVLNKLDPVKKGCPAGGLVVASGVQLNLGGITLSGSGGGVGITAGPDSTVIGGTVRGFGTGIAVPAGHATLTGLSINSNDVAGLVVGSPAATLASATVGGSGTSISDNNGAGIVIHPVALLTISGSSDTARLPVLRNRGVGIDVRGALRATLVNVGYSGNEGLRVDTQAPVELFGCDVHDSGNHPGGALPDKAGILALQTDLGTGLRLASSVLPFGTGLIHDNSGHGVAVGDASLQTGLVFGFVGDQQIYRNDEGIHVAQRDSVAQATSSTIVSNNIYDNRGAGVHLGTSTQRYIVGPDERTFSSNDVHHNAVTGEGCVPATASQADSQIVVDGPISGTDPTVSNQSASGCPTDTDGGVPCVPCGSDPDSNCMGPNSLSFDRDFICYWGAANDGTAASRNDSPTNCNQMNNPNGPDSGGINNHCLWNGTQCRFAWDMGGREGIAECDSSRNRIYGYVNDQIQNPASQKGLAAKFGAYVRARRNTWGSGGPLNGIYEDTSSDSRIDPDDDCGSISTCP